MSRHSDLLEAFERHSTEKIRSALDAGASPVDPIGGKSPLLWLMEMYSRSPKFGDCIRVMLDAGATFNDPVLEAILLDEPGRLPSHTSTHRIDLACTFTPLRDVSPLHLCAEYNSLQCAKALLANGADVNAKSGINPQGYGGHTPIFHTVNSPGNYTRSMLELLVESGADLNIQVKRLTWGEGFKWETDVFDVTPISYAQCGLLRQFQRTEKDIYGNIAYLLQHRDGTAPLLRNIPNRYLS